MTKKLNCIMLIDDDEPTNFLHKLVIRNAEVTKTAKDISSGETTLALLSDENSENEGIDPDLIFLDINMPGMNGWEFLEAYKKLGRSRNNKDYYHNAYNLFESRRPCPC